MEVQGKISKSHNALSTEYIITLYNSDILSKYDPLSHLTRTIFDIHLVTSWRRGKLQNLEVSDVQLTKHRGQDVYKITNRIATPNGNQIAQVTLQSVTDKPMTITI